MKSVETTWGEPNARWIPRLIAEVWRDRRQSVSKALTAAVKAAAVLEILRIVVETRRAGARSDSVESDHVHFIAFERDLFRKSVPTFRDHALEHAADSERARTQRRGCRRVPGD